MIHLPTLTKRLPYKLNRSTFLTTLLAIALCACSLVLFLNIRESMVTSAQLSKLKKEQSDLQKQFATITKDYTTLKNEDQVAKNNTLQEEVRKINTTYKKSISVYEKLLEFKATSNTKIETYDKLYTQTLLYLSDKNYASAESNLSLLTKQLDDEKAKLTATFTIPATAVSSNNPPASGGYSRQKVTTSIGDFLIDIVAGDLSSTKVIVDTASDSDCRDNCPVLSLADYVSRNGAYAGVNGSYFCPASYPSCAGKTNSFDTLLMNKNKTYFNSDNNVYSTVHAVIFLGGSVRFVSRSLEWGRDTGADGVIANQPLLLMGGNITFGGDGDPKKGGKGIRSFVGSRGNIVYIGVVHNATVAEVAHALKALGLENAINLDSGGSTALWHGGYKAGPGRNIPNAILFLRK